MQTLIFQIKEHNIKKYAWLLRDQDVLWGKSSLFFHFLTQGRLIINIYGMSEKSTYYHFSFAGREVGRRNLDFVWLYVVESNEIKIFICHHTGNIHWTYLD